MFLEGVSVEALQELVDNPPVDGAAMPVLIAEPSTPTDDAVPVLALEYAGAKSSFGDVGVELPEGLEIEAKPAAFLSACLEPQSGSASELVGRHILYRWPTRLGGWLVGKVISANTDPTVTVGEDVANFVVYYEADAEEAQHCLKRQKYAKSAKATTDSWVLLGPAQAQP